MKESCRECGKTIAIGQWPYCPHEPLRHRPAAAFSPIVVFKAKDGTYRFPGRSNARTPAGCQRVEITNQYQADRLEREVNYYEKQRYEESKYQQSQAGWDAGWNRTRASLRAELERRRAQFSPAGKQAIEYLINKERAEQSHKFDPGFHIEVMHHDRSNREPHNDIETGWKDRRD